ncbi:MAG TPA: hypothetical protein VGM23_10195 [Armatimonadota bacterium]
MWKLQVAGWMAICFGAYNLVREIANSTGDASAFIAGIAFSLLQIAPGLAILSKRKWGWWLLTTFSILGIFVCLFGLGQTPLVLLVAGFWAIILGLLLTIPPSRWAEEAWDAADMVEEITKKQGGPDSTPEGEAAKPRTYFAQLDDSEEKDKASE